MTEFGFLTDHSSCRVEVVLEAGRVRAGRFDWEASAVGRHVRMVARGQVMVVELTEAVTGLCVWLFS